MLYALIGSGLLGALSTAFLLWRKSVVEKDLVGTKAKLEDAKDRANRAMSELVDRQKIYDDQLQRYNAQIETLRTQRDAALQKLTKNGTPGSIAELIQLQAIKKPGVS